jgi:Domain of unknown function (DUF4795)
MTSEHLFNFTDLLNLTFDNDSLHIKNLQMLFKILVAQLKLDDVQVSFGDQNFLSNARGIQVSREPDDTLKVTKGGNKGMGMDRVIPTIPKPEEVVDHLCSSKSTNPIVDMLDLLNITKRVEAVEISIHKLTSLMESILKKETSHGQKVSEVKGEGETASTLKKDSLNSVSVSNQELPTSSYDVNSQPSASSQLSSSTKDSYQSQQASEETFFKSPSLKCCPTPIDFEVIIKQEIDAASLKISEKISTLTKSICDIQKKIMTFQDTIDDLLFSCEQNDLKCDDTAWEIKDFNSKIFCLKSDVKSLLTKSEEFKERFIAVDAKYETMNNVKTNKSYVDELWSQKASKSDLELFVPRDEFDPLTDILRLKFSSLNEHFEKLQENTKKILACLKSEVDEKLGKNEIKKFKETTTKLFDEFVDELKILLHQISNNPLGLAGTQTLDPNLNCISCESKISMVKAIPNIPKLSAISIRFKLDLNKIPVKSAKETSNEDFRHIFCRETKAVEVMKLNCNNQKNLLNFPNSQECFIIAKDNSIYKADPMKCLKNPRYMKS